MKSKLKKVAAGTPGRKKARKPIAVRGKKTKKAGMMAMAKKLRDRATKAPLKKVSGMSPGFQKAVTGAATGMSGAGLAALAKKIKKQMGKKSGGMITPEQMKKIMGTQPFRKPGKPGMKPVLDSQGNPVKNLFQKDNRPKRRIRMLRKAMKSPVAQGKMKRPKK